MLITDKFYKYQKGPLTLWVQRDANILFATMASRFSRTNLPTEALFSKEFGGDVSDEVIGCIFADYGDRSVGKLIKISVIVEGISIVDAMCLKESRIGNECIEASTRYLNFESGSFTGNETLCREWLSFYSAMLPEADAYVRSTQPREEGVPIEAYESAVTAMAFDICREFLPMGMHTRLGATINFLTLSRNIHKWRASETPAVRDLAELFTSYVEEHLPFLAKALAPERSPYPEAPEPIFTVVKLCWEHLNILTSMASPDFPNQTRITKQLAQRKHRHHTIPKALEKIQVDCEFHLPFHATRELLRHVYMTRTKFAMALGGSIEVMAFADGSPLKRHETAFNNLLSNTYNTSRDPNDFPMCTTTHIKTTINHRELIYMTELRTADGVNPTLFKIFKQIANRMRRYYTWEGIIDGLFFGEKLGSLGRLESERRALRRKKLLLGKK